MLVLTSCISKRTNIIIDGHYFGISSRDQSISCDLFIEPISEEVYLNANGKNVIKDAITGSCYSLQFIVFFSENNTQQIDFINLKDAYDGATVTPIRYVDDNDCWPTPFTTLNNEIRPKSECYYSIYLNID